MTQCQCLTGKGTQCSRKAKGAAKYCYQHQNCKKVMVGAVTPSGEVKKMAMVAKAKPSTAAVPKMVKVYPTYLSIFEDSKLPSDIRNWAGHVHDEFERYNYPEVPSAELVKALSTYDREIIKSAVIEEGTNASDGSSMFENILFD